LLLWLVALGLAGCQDSASGKRATIEKKDVLAVEQKRGFDRGQLVDNIKDNGIQVGDDLYMIPTGVDVEGCETFNAFSSTNPVPQAVHYRQADGSFGIAKDPAICRVELVGMGLDEDGCERYRAVPINKELPINEEVVYYMTAEGTYSARKPEARCG
jgi:hypothetical protein